MPGAVGGENPLERLANFLETEKQTQQTPPKKYVQEITVLVQDVLILTTVSPEDQKYIRVIENRITRLVGNQQKKVADKLHELTHPLKHPAEATGPTTPKEDQVTSGAAGAIAPTGKPPPPGRQTVVAKLVEATGFDKTYFDDLSDAQIAKLIPVFTDLVGLKKTSKDVKTSKTGEKLTYAKFSRRVFTDLPASLSLYIDPDTQKLQLFEDKHPPTIIGRGTYKTQKLGKGEVKDYVKGTFKDNIDSPYRDDLLREQLLAYGALRSKVDPALVKHLCLPEVVIYRSEKTGRIKKILLSPYMNLRDLKVANYDIPADQRISVLLQIAQGVKAMHDSGYAHLDIKGANILLHKNADGTFSAKLTDFDIIFDTTKLGDYYGIDDVISTFTYMAPEIDATRSPVPNKNLKQCDIYSLGALFGNFGTKAPPLGNEAKFFKLIDSMEKKNASARPTIEQVIAQLEAMR